jgi:hypothetical protein
MKDLMTPKQWIALIVGALFFTVALVALAGIITEWLAG